MKKIVAELTKIMRAVQSEEDISKIAQAFVEEFGDNAEKIAKDLGGSLEDIIAFKDEGDEGYELKIGSEEWRGFNNYDDAKEKTIRCGSKKIKSQGTYWYEQPSAQD